MDNIEIKVLHPWLDRDFRAHCLYDDAAGKYIIELPKGASLKTKLHELGHAYFKYFERYLEVDTSSLLFWKNLVEQELDAEMYVYKVLNRVVTWQILLKPLASLFYYRQGRRWHSISWLFNLALSILQEQKLYLPPNGRSRLWWALRDINEGNLLKAVVGIE